MRKYGYATLIIGRFLAIVHNLAPIMSGIAKTPILGFMVVNIIGATLWVFSAVFIGYFIGQSVPNAPKYVIPFVIIFMIFINLRPIRKQLQKIVEKIEVS